MEWVKLGEIAEVNSGGTPRRSNNSYWKKGNIPWIKISDMKGKYINSSEEFITESGLNNSSARLFKEGTILYTIFATIGEVSILKTSATTNQAIAGINIINDSFNIDYIYYYLLSIKDKMKKESRGVAQNNINLTILKNLEVPFIVIEKQKEIVDVLNGIENLIRLRKEQIQAYDDLIESLFYSLFEDLKLESNPLKNFIIFSNNSVSNFDEYLDENYIGVEDIEKDTGRILKVKKVSDSNIKSSKNYFSKNDLLYSRIRPNLNKVSLPNFDGLVSSEVFVINCTEKINKYFLAYTMRSKKFVSYAILNSSGANFPRVSKKTIENFKAKVPPIEMQNKFADYVLKIEEEKKKLRESLAELEDLFNALMQDAFSGNLFKDLEGRY